VNEFISANGNPDVRGGLSRGAVNRVEEDQVTGTKIRGIDVGPGAELVRDSPRHMDTILIEDVPDEAAAIESGGIVTAIPVRRAAEL
jgi:hypothetical protein